MKKIFVLDTNIILNDGDCLQSFGDNDITVPIEVITELDRFKVGLSDINYNARKFLRTVAMMSHTKIFNGGDPLGEGLGNLRITSNLEYHENVAKNFKRYQGSEPIVDHEILNTTYCLTLKEKERGEDIEVVLVTKDLNLQIKAWSLHLSAEDYKNDITPNATSYYQKARCISIKPASVNELYEKKEINFHEKIEAHENEPLILNSKSQKSALSVFKNGKLNLITKDSMIPFGIKALNSEQAFALYALLNPAMKFVTLAGKAGTGKTLLALAAAFKLLKENVYDQIILCRNIVAVGADIGYLPGDADDKVKPYMGAFADNIAFISKNITFKNEIKQFEHENKIFYIPTSLLRGRSITKTIFIIDESQNLTPNEVKTIVTRAGEGTKVIMLGDVQQIDLPHLTEASNGFVYAISRFLGKKIHSHVVLVKGERSELAELAGELL